MQGVAERLYIKRRAFDEACWAPHMPRFMREFALRNRVEPIARFDSRVSAYARAEVENAAQRVYTAIWSSKLSLSKTSHRNNGLR